MTNINRRTILKASLGAPFVILTAQAAQAATTHKVAIKNFKFDVAEIAIKVGDTVRFTNNDSAPHTATADGGSFDTGSLKKGKSGDVTFASAGDFTYFCKFHRKMKGVVRVSA